MFQSSWIWVMTWIAFGFEVVYLLKDFCEISNKFKKMCLIICLVPLTQFQYNICSNWKKHREINSILERFLYTSWIGTRRKLPKWLQLHFWGKWLLLIFVTYLFTVPQWLGIAKDESLSCIRLQWLEKFWRQACCNFWFSF